MLTRKKRPYAFLLLFALLMIQTALHAQEYDTIKSINDPEPVVADSVLMEPPPAVDGGNYASNSSKGNFSDISDSAVSINPQHKVPDSAMKRLLADDDYWYANKEEEKEKPKAQSNNDSSSFLDSDAGSYIVWGLLVALMVGAIVIYLKDNQINFFASRSKKLKTDSAEEQLPENIFEINYELSINKAIQEQNYRLATRLLFLRSLKMLSNKRIIDYAVDRTNFDYLFQLSGTKYHPLFFKLVRNYEYLWYGKFEVNEEQFTAIRKGFEELQKQLV